MTTKQTHTPWKAEKSGVYSGHNIRDARGHTVGIAHTPDVAELFALAPEMADALRSLMFCLESPLAEIQGVAVLMRPSLNQARALLAKLDGAA